MKKAKTAKKKTVIKKKKGCFYTPCENCGKPRYECSCFPDKKSNEDLGCLHDGD